MVEERAESVQALGTSRIPCSVGCIPQLSQLLPFANYGLMRCYLV